MSRPEPLDGPTPAWRPAALPAVPTPMASALAAPPAWEEPACGMEPPQPPNRFLSPRTIMRAAARYWWQILLLWGVGSTLVVWLVYTNVKPTFEAFALLQIEDPLPKVFNNEGGSGGQANTTQRMETQAKLITNPEVLSAALVVPEVAKLERVRMSLDAEAELRRDLRTMIVPGTTLIQVSMASPVPTEAATIVNAVVDAYLEKTKHQYEEQSEDLKKQFVDLQDNLERDVREKIEALKKLYNGRGPVRPTDVLDDNETTVRNPEHLKTNITIEEYVRFSRRLDDLDQEMLLQQRKLGRLRVRQASEQPNAEAELEQAVQEALAQDRELEAIRQHYHAAQRQLQYAQNAVRKGGDPALQNALKQRQQLWEAYQNLHAQKLAEYRNGLARRQIISTLDQEIQEIENQMRQMEDQREILAQELQKLKVQVRDEQSEALDQSLAQFELNWVREKQAKVNSYLAQLEFELNRGRPQIRLQSPARASPLPNAGNRMAMMGAGPIGVLVVVLALFTFLEVRAGRVADPDDLPVRARLGVIGVVPPLPSNRGMLGRPSPEKLQRQVAEFVQSLDHLRVLLCAGNRAGIGTEPRVVLITSACSGEGKTTLAAQLAGRCANAGLSTLLVDADLRRPKLAELLEVPDGPGLADILAGEVEPEAAMLVIGNAGGFHLLPAGTMGLDPSRLLQGERLGQLMERLRASFDVVLIDAPPVLAVPDAILVGRWTDGAVLTVRHDTSRFPLVERAHRRLSVVGVPVLGAVINGIRSPEATYSQYGYSYSGQGSSPPAPPPDDLS